MSLICSVFCNWAVGILMKTNDFNDALNSGKVSILYLLKGPIGLSYDVKVGVVCILLSRCGKSHRVN